MMLADLVRTDRHNHRQLGEDSELAEAIKVLARSHKSLNLDPPAARQSASVRLARVLPWSS